MPIHVIYIPGLGDHRSYSQDKGIRLWRLFGLRTHYLPLGWANKEGFEAKLSRLLELVGRLRRQGHEVVLVGVSAGASAVLAAYAQRQQEIKAVVCIGGKIHNPQTIGEHIYRKNPDFYQSMALVSKNLSKLKKKGLLDNILSLHGLRDKSVPPADSRVEGAASKTLPGWSHVSGIFWGVLLGGLVISRFLRLKPGRTS